MQHLFQSAFLQALGYAIANSLWQTAFLWILYTGVSALPSLSSAARYRLAVLVQLTGFIWFLFTFRFYYGQAAHAWQLPGGTTDPFATVGNTIPGFYDRILNWVLKAELLLPYLSMAYLLLMAFLCIRWITGYRRTQRVRSNGLVKMPVEWRLFVQRTAGQLGLRRKVWVSLSAMVASPLTIGFWKPVILVPVASINHLSIVQMEAVLLHELAHIKRCDYLVNMVLSVVEIALFFNPFTQLIRKSIYKERENSCDDWVLQFQYEATDYAEALLRIACLPVPSFAMAAAGKKNDLLVRVKRMIGEKENRFNYRRQLMALLIIAGILGSLAWFTPVASQKGQGSLVKIVPEKPIRQKKIQPKIAGPTDAMADNPLFNPVFFLSKPLKETIGKNLNEAKQLMEEHFEKELIPQPPGPNGILDMVMDIREPGSDIDRKQKTDLAEEMPVEASFQFLYKRSGENADSAIQGHTRTNIKNTLAAIDLKKINTTIRKVRQEMAVALKGMAVIRLQKPKPDQEIKLTMLTLDELKFSEPEKLILGSLDAIEPVMVLKEKKEQIADHTASSFVSPDENDLPLPLAPPRFGREKTDEEMTEVFTTVIPVQFREKNIRYLLEVVSGNKEIDPVLLSRLKMLLQKKMQHALHMRFVPAVTKTVRDSSGDQPLIIRLQ